MTESSGHATRPSSLIAERDDRIAVEVALPLPVDVVSTLGNLLEAAYPGTMIDTNAGFGLLRLLLPEGSRKSKRVTKKAAAEAVVEASEDAMDALGFQSSENGVTLSMSAPEALTRAILPLVQATLDETMGATNYVEQHVQEKDPPYRHFVVIACRSERQTPHALRMEAEKRIAAALALCDEWGDGVSPEASGMADAVRAVLTQKGSDR